MTGLDLFAEKITGSSKLHHICLTSAQGLLTVSITRGEMTPPKQGNNRGENPQKLSIVSRSQNQ